MASEPEEMRLLQEDSTGERLSLRNDHPTAALPEGANSMSMNAGSKAIDATTLDSTRSLPVYDENGHSVEFGSLFSEQKTIIVFIRTFVCGFCQAYVEELGKVPKSALDAAGTRIVVIGCGEWSVIKSFRGHTNNYPYEVYTEPTRKLYSALGLISNGDRAPKGEKKSYAPGMGTVLASFAKQALSLFGAIGKAGNLSQLGGDFVFGPGNTVAFASRMKNIEDHVEVKELMAAAGVHI